MENKREELKKFLDKLKFVLSDTCEIERKKQLRLYFLIEIISISVLTVLYFYFKTAHVEIYNFIAPMTEFMFALVLLFLVFYVAYFMDKRFKQQIKKQCFFQISMPNELIEWKQNENIIKRLDL